MHFHLFGELPPEIRAEIWKLSLPEVEPEVCIVESSCDTPQSLLVYTAFPALMHVCHESRQFVQNSRLSDIKFTRPDSATDKIEFFVPFRHYQPEMDTLFCQNQGPASLEDIASEEDFEHVLQETRHLAIPGEKEFLDLVAWVLTFYFPKLETLSVVVKNPSHDSCFGSYFDAPKTRCKLRQVSAEDTHTYTVDVKDLDGSETWDPSHLSKSMREYTQELEKIIEECFNDMDVTLRRAHRWWNRESKTFKRVQYLTQTFVEYETGSAFRLAKALS
ncbi:hypothetical protein CSAL01_03984 [Colletotrichum salicis]|uniref:2EXR domain-containing protein n=1 Tax=Colletotrichum salicis TaxID=1209931 RepID=A0A135T6P8_9PEZI|nr:hypothetical protein CSAL01_03984 [Colletotrichum salicis]